MRAEPVSLIGLGWSGSRRLKPQPIDDEATLMRGARKWTWGMPAEYARQMRDGN